MGSFPGLYQLSNSAQLLLVFSAFQVAPFISIVWAVCFKFGLCVVNMRDVIWTL